jgi:hypothetical protein
MSSSIAWKPSDVLTVAKHRRASGWRNLLACFSQIMEVDHREGPAPVLKTSASAIEKMLNSPQLCDEGIKSQLRRVFSKFATLLAKRPKTFLDNNYTHVKTFSPLEMVVVSVLLAMYPERNDRTLQGDILFLRMELRKANKDLKLNATLWRDAWYLLENLERVRGAVDGTTGEAATELSSSSDDPDSSANGSSDDQSIRGAPRRSKAAPQKKDAAAKQTGTKATAEPRSLRKTTATVANKVGSAVQSSSSANPPQSIIGTDRDVIVRAGKTVTGRQVPTARTSTNSIGSDLVGGATLGPRPGNARASIGSDLVGGHPTRLPMAIRGNSTPTGASRNEPIAAATMRVDASDKSFVNRTVDRVQPKDSRGGDGRSSMAAGGSDSRGFSSIPRRSPPANASARGPSPNFAPMAPSAPMAPIAPMAPFAPMGAVGQGAVAATPVGPRKRRERLDLSGVPSSAADIAKRAKFGTD